MARVGKEGLLAFFDCFVVSGGASRRRLSTHVFAQKGAPKSLKAEPLGDDFWAPPLDGLAKDWAADRVV